MPSNTRSASLSNAQPDKFTVRRMVVRFAVSSIFLAVVVTGNFFLSEQRIAATKFISDVMDNMGQQRMLAQRIALLSRSMIDSPYASARKTFREEIKSLADVFETTHEDLLRGELSEKLPRSTREKVQSVYLEKPFYLEKNIKQFIASARSFAGASNEALSVDNPYFLYIQSLAQSDRLVNALNLVVSHYQHESSMIIRRGIRLGRMQLAIFFLLLTGLVVFVFSPMVRLIRNEIERLEGDNVVLDQQAQEMTVVNKKIKDKESALFEIMEDITVQKKNLQVEVAERKKAEIAQQALMDKLERVNKELNEFSYVVSHDLKAPLRGIGSLATWLVKDYGDKLDKEAKESLDLIADRVKRMSHLIDGLLQLAKLGRTEGELQEVDLRVLMREVVDFINPPASLSISLAPDLPTVFCDRTRIHQVFQNLLSNAIKYMDKPHGQIAVSVADRNDFWEFSVQDDGPGIDKKHHEKIFKIFQTLAPRDSSESTGIGLSIVKKIVETYGGKTWIDSELGAGSKFSFTLPKAAQRGMAYAA